MIDIDNLSNEELKELIKKVELENEKLKKEILEKMKYIQELTHEEEN